MCAKIKCKNIQTIKVNNVQEKAKLCESMRNMKKKINQHKNGNDIQKYT